jgi:choline dehydrogenase
MGNRDTHSDAFQRPLSQNVSMQQADVIIVGAGSAGCVLADRLTESGRLQVLVLEAGGRDNHPWIHIPMGYGKLFNHPTLNWSYESEPEPHCNGRRIFTPRGKVLGGSSSINGLVYIRGQAQDFDLWNIPGWSYADLLPSFIKAEDQSRGANEWHGVGGPFAVSDLPDQHPLCEAFIASAQAIGVPRNDDFNGATQEGAGYFQANTRNGRRISTAAGYLKRARKRPNLRLEVHAHTTRILFEGRRAVGVEYLQNGQRHQVRAGHVILAGGAFNSPQLLQLSGIGPGALLRQHGIEVVHDLPDVGAHLQDHFYVRNFFRSRLPITVNDDMAHWWGRLGMGLRWALQRRGPLAISAGYAAAFVKTRPELVRPDAQFYFINFSLAKRGGVLDRHSGFTCSVSQLQAKSRGWVKLRSADPLAAPLIQYNYLDDADDRQTMVEALKLLRRLVQTPPFSDHVAEEIKPGPGVITDEQWLQYCREVGDTVYHPTSTCRLGTDEASVVDPQLRVRGTQGLWVMDASIMPSVVSGNTNAATVAIAEKGADLFLANAEGL